VRLGARFGLGLMVAVLTVQTGAWADGNDWLQAAVRVSQLIAASKYDQALIEARAVLRTVQDQFGPQSEQVGFVLYEVGAAQQATHDEAGAEKSLRRSLALLKGKTVQFASLVPGAEMILGLALANQGRVAEGEAQLAEALSDAKNISGIATTSVADIAFAYASQLVTDKNTVATPAVVAETKRLYQLAYATRADKSMQFYELASRAGQLLGDDAQLEPNLLAWLGAATNPAGGDTASARRALAALMTFNNRTGNNAALLQYAKRKVDFDQTAADNPALIYDYQLLTNAAWALNDGPGAIGYAKRAIDLTNGTSDPTMRGVNWTSRIFLTAAYASLGDVDAARQTTESSLTIDRAWFGEQSEAVARDLGSRAMQRMLLDPKAALDDIKRAVTDIEGASSVTFATSPLFIYTFAAEVYASQGDTTNAIATARKALAASKDPAVSAHVAAVMAAIYAASGQNELVAGAIDTAEKYMRTAGPASDAKTLEAMLGFVRLTTSLNGGKYAAAIQDANDALAALQRAGLDGSYDAKLLMHVGLARAYWGAGRNQDARLEFNQLLKIGRNGFAASVLTDVERRKYLQQFAIVFDALESYVAADPNNVEDAKLLFDAMLIKKGMVAQSLALRNVQAQGANSTALEALGRRLSAERAQFASLGFSPQSNIAGAIANDQRELTRLLPTGDAAAATTWQDIQARLKPGEVAIDFSQFVREDRPAGSGDIWYLAAVLKSSGPPVVVMLGTSKDIEGPALRSYAQDVGLARSGAPSGVTYAKFWAPILNSLGGAKTLYISTDGVLDVMNPSLVRLPSGKYLLDDYDVRVLGSLREILKSNAAANAKTATIIADPAFNGDPNQPCPSSLLARSTAADGTLPRLCASQTEAAAVAKNLATAGYSVSGPYTGTGATKQRLLQTQHPGVLHIATHGFFVQEKAPALGLTIMGAFDDASDADPLLRSGLFLANSSAAVKAGTYSGEGVLTAYEAVGMPLSGTELVVLSACDTGIGQVDYYGQGSYSLPQAFLEAGAHSVLMSMWSIPDTETTELMSAFYHLWLDEHLDKHEALRQAEIYERAKVIARYGDDRPQLWGAFVLYGN
jgi:CHAT domain-containing protein